MASFSSKIALLSLVAIFANSLVATIADPDIKYDFILPENVNASKFKVNQDTKYNILADAFDGVGIATRQFPAGSINPPNAVPYSAELLFLWEGTLEVGFVDTKNKLYTRTLQAGDMFLIPTGLVHFYYNPSKSSEARFIAVYGGPPGTILFPTTLFSSGVDDGILVQSFKTDVATIQKLKAGLAAHT